MDATMNARFVLRMLLAITIATTVWMIAGTASSQEIPMSSLIPPKALDAIKRSQGQILISEDRFDGTKNNHFFSGFLVSKEKRYVLAVLHGLPSEKHSAEHPDLIKFFREIPASNPGETPKAVSVSCMLKKYWYEQDLALLELAEVPMGMEEVSFAKDVSVPSRVYAAFFGIQEFEIGSSQDVFIFFRWLPFWGTIVLEVPMAHFKSGTPKPSSDSFFYVFGNGPMKGGFSGTMFVNERGDVVGMGSYTDRGYSAITNVKTITRLLAEFEKEGDTKR